MGFFEELGNSILNASSTTASSVAGNLIGIISPVAAAGVAVYLIWYGFKVSHGQVGNVGGSTLMLALKIALISVLVLNAANFMRVAEGGKDALESALTGALNLHGAYSVFDNLFLKVKEIFAAIVEGFGAVGWSPSGFIAGLFLIAILVLVGGASVALFGSAFMLLLFNDLMILLCLSFGPAFAATLLFPALTGFFSAWLRALIVPVVAKSLIAFVFNLIQSPVETYLNQAQNLFSGDQVEYQTLALQAIMLCIIFLGSSAIIGALQLGASNLVGSMALGNVGSVGGSLFSKVQSTKSFVRGGATGLRGESPVPMGRPEGLAAGGGSALGSAGGRSGATDAQLAAMPKGDTLGYTNSQYSQAYQRSCAMNDMGRLGYQIGAGLRMGYQGGKGLMRGAMAVENAAAKGAMWGYDHIKGWRSDRANRNSGIFQ